MSAHVELFKQTGGWMRGAENEYGDIELIPRPSKWRWRFVKNGRIMADSGQGYSRRIDALNGCATVLGGVACPAGGHEIHRAGWATVPVRDLTRQP